MKKMLSFIVIIIVVAGVLYFIYRKEAVAPVAPVPVAEDVKITSEAVDKYLRENIVKLSPVKAVLGGTWYVVSLGVDLEANSGTVVYEDGHVQEKRTFTYTTNEKGEIKNLIIK